MRFEKFVPGDLLCACSGNDGWWLTSAFDDNPEDSFGPLGLVELPRDALCIFLEGDGDWIRVVSPCRGIVVGWILRRVVMRA